ncbi:MAG TPA: 2-oxoglutarate dehydrogenase, E2 component, dihydrolipoamide succinyltransferase [Kineosporiaceae bacterium]|nr:2-oxoglutarate dehydrogenase, E2 component, dihydrolipoamide succinyltransferase [Kineosporiaceae bacterium]
MSDSVQMPALGESVTEGTVTRWLKQVGEHVEADEPLLEVSTDKVDTEIPSPVSGVLQRILVSEDETVAVGTPLAVIGDGAESTPSDQARPAPAGVSVPAPGVAAPPARAASTEVGYPAEPAPTAEPAGGEGSRVQMPALGESVTEGTVTRWLKREGDTVDVDEPLLEVSTDKVDTEIPSPVAGVVRTILVAEDETVPVGADLVIVGPAGAVPTPAPSLPAPAPAPPAPSPPAPAPVPPPAPRAPAPIPAAAVAAPRPAPAPAPARTAPTPGADIEDYPGPSPEPISGPPSGPAELQAAGAVRAPEPPVRDGHADSSTYVTPLVRRLATEQDVDLSSIKGTGVGGRIRKQDVLDAARAREARAAAPRTSAAPAAVTASAPGGGRDLSALRGTTEKMSRLRRVIAQRMVESLQVSAQLTTVLEADVTRIARLRDRAKRDFEAREGVKLSFLPFFALAAVEALKQFPIVNASIEGDQIVYHAEENLGVAVDTDRGLLVPVIRNAGDLNIAGIARKIADLADRTRSNRITPDELGGGTFTLTNTGSRGALFDTPIINQPQVAILGTGAVVKRPIVVTDVDGGETISIRSMVYLALTYDHRLVDGADAARFLVAVKHRLEEGAFDADLGI